ncbi:MAG: type 1 glutamine amidotransferase domain-containing protein [Bacteroidota bacterium]
MDQVQNLKNKKVAILVTDGFEEIELKAPYDELKSNGATVHIVSDKGKIKSWKDRDWGEEFNTDQLLDKAEINDYDMLILPGGTINPDLLRRNADAVEFVRQFNETGKPIAAICHGPQMLIEAGIVEGREVTSFFSVKTDLINAGAKWRDATVVESGNLITSRNPGDIPAFLKKIINVLKVQPEHAAS